MRNWRFLYFIFCLSCIIGYTRAQGPGIKFDNSIHNFGQIKEQDGPVSHTFWFANNGDSLLVVNDVLVSCGCTTPDWTRTPVKPGERGFIKVEYDPVGQPGDINKYLTIKSNALVQQTKLYIRGEVITMAKPAEKEYPIEVGGMRIKNKIVSLGTINNEKPLIKTFRVYNDMNKPMIFEEEYKAPDHIKVKFLPQSIAPKSVGMIEVTYDPRKINSFGIMSNRISVETDEWFNSVKEFLVIAFLEEYFPPMSTEEVSKAPRLQINETQHSFGTIKMGDIVSKDFILTNTGKKNLIIRQTFGTCGCTASAAKKSTLSPGESTSLAVTFDSAGRKGNQNKIVYIFANDPVNPTQKIKINAEVLAEEQQ